jgi:hypothetical protein
MAIRKIVARSIGVDVIVAEDIAANAITAAEISSNAVTTAKINDGAVTTAKIADANVTSGKLASSITITTLTGTNDATISGLTVGKGGGSQTTNTVVGNGALNGNSSGTGVTAVGSSALPVSTASNNTGLGRVAGNNTTSGADNTFLGMQSGYTNITGASNVYTGVSAGYTATGSYNTFVGQGSGETITSGAKNSILGRYNGNQGLLDIRTSSNNMVLSDGDGNPRQFTDSTNTTYRWNNTSAFGWSKSITGAKTAGSSGSSTKLVQIGPTCALTVKIMAIQSGGEQNSAQLVGNITVAYGGGGTVAGQSAATQGNISGISIAYDNGGSPIYTINCTLTYSGAAPTIYYVIEGLSTYNFTPL